MFPSLDSEINGTLEDLCLEMLSRENAMGILEITDETINKVEEEFGELTWQHKSRLHTYLSLNDRFVSLKLGEAAKANAFDFESDKLAPLKAMLLEVVNVT